MRGPNPLLLPLFAHAPTSIQLSHSTEQNRNKRAISQHRRIKSNQLQSTCNQVTAHAASHASPSTAGRSATLETLFPIPLPRLLHTPSHMEKLLGITWPWFSSPTPHWESFLTLSSNNSGTSTWACVPHQLQEIAPYSQQKVAGSACLPRKLLPATCTQTCCFSTLKHAQLELLSTNELSS